MANCKDCYKFKRCGKGDGTTRYYGEKNAYDNVQELCPFFVSSEIHTQKEQIKQLVTEPKHVDAIKLIRDFAWYSQHKEQCYGNPCLTLDEIVGTILDAISKNADTPEQPKDTPNETTEIKIKGTWIFDDHDETGVTYKCSDCGHSILVPTKFSITPDRFPRCSIPMNIR